MKKHIIVATIVLIMAAFAPQGAQAIGLPIETADAGNSILKQMGDIFQSAMTTITTQIGLNGMDMAAHTGAQLPVARDYTIHPELYKACATAQSEAAGAGIKNNVNGIAAGMANVPNQTVGVSPGQLLASASKSGNLDPVQNPNLCKQTPDKCANFDLNRRDHDITTAITDDMMEVPPLVAIANGTATKLDASLVTDIHQKNYIDKMNACYNLRPADPANFAGPPGGAASAQADIAVLGAEEQRKQKDRMSGAIFACTHEVERNSAISQATASALGGSFQAAYYEEQNKCAALKVKLMSDTALDNCATLGISDARIEKIENARFASPNFPGYLSGKGLGGKDIAIAEEQHDDIERVVDVMRENTTFMKTVAANTMPRDSGVGPGAMELKTALLDAQKNLFDEQRKQFSEMTGLLRALVDTNQAIIANQKHVQEAKAGGVNENYRATPADLKAP